jgi:hypothetical protein
VDADKHLFDHGTDALRGGTGWWPASISSSLTATRRAPYRQESKLGIGDSYLGEDSLESNILR